MMDCKEFRELLDRYVDSELPVEAVAAAEAHFLNCPRCARAVAHLERMQRAVRQAVASHTPPADLDRRVRRSFKPWWVPGSLSAPIGRRLAVAAVLVLAVGVGLTSANGSGVAEAVAGAMDRVVIQWTSPSDVTIEGRLVCRDCELEKRHGERAMCSRIGHHGAIETRDGRIWNIVEQPASADLIHNNALLGKMVRVRARLFREAGSLSIATYTIVG